MNPAQKFNWIAFLREKIAGHASQDKRQGPSRARMETETIGKGKIKGILSCCGYNVNGDYYQVVRCTVTFYQTNAAMAIVSKTEDKLIKMCEEGGVVLREHNTITIGVGDVYN